MSLFGLSPLHPSTAKYIPLSALFLRWRLDACKCVCSTLWALQKTMPFHWRPPSLTLPHFRLSFSSQFPFNLTARKIEGKEEDTQAWSQAYGREDTFALVKCLIKVKELVSLNDHETDVDHWLPSNPPPLASSYSSSSSSWWSWMGPSGGIWLRCHLAPVQHRQRGGDDQNKSQAKS